MKLLITTLAMIFMSFGAQAYKIEKIYKFCKPYQTAGFKADSLNISEKEYASVCLAYLKGITDLGFLNCLTLSAINKNVTIPSNVTGALYRNTNKEPPTYAALITSFINFAENNTNLWEDFVTLHADKFLGNKFPCDLKNP